MFPSRCGKVRCGLWTSVCLFFGTEAALHAGWRLRVDAAYRPGVDVVIETSLPADFPKVRVVRLVADAPRTYSLPGQVEAQENGARSLFFVIPASESARPGRYAVVPGHPETPRDHGIHITPRDGNAEIRVDGRLLTVWRKRSGTKPVCFPILGPQGLPMTRNWPMKKGVPGERHDHPHHRSFWFAHGDVNGIDFWTERPGRTGTIVQRSIECTDGPVFGTVRAVCDWMSSDGRRRVCSDERVLRVYAAPTGRLFDFTVRLIASDGPVVMGDTKEGTLAFRTAATMKPDAGKGGVVLLADGSRNRAAWGRRAKWLDAWGPVKGKIVGIAMLEHPTSFRAPTWWHARTYGLIAANPFGWSYFMHDKTKDGRYRIPQGQHITFRFRIWLHEGDAKSARVEDVWWNYAHPPAVHLERVPDQ